MIGGVLVGIFTDKIGAEIPDPIGTFVMVLLYILPLVLGIPLFLKGK